MRITYSSTLLCSSDPAQRHGPVSPSFNGQPVIDVAQLFRADNATVYGRGDGPVEFGFSAWHKFASEAEVVLFCATHRETLPVQADLTVTDDEETVAAVMEDAVRTVRIAEVFGTSVLVQYGFTGSRFTSEEVPDAPTDTDTVKAYDIALTEGTIEQAVAYDTPFASNPRAIPLPSLCIPEGGSSFGMVIDQASRTAAGFTVKFENAVPAAGYRISGLVAL